ncbi:hypothetical protein [Kosmotoga arenicorallina]|uniref:hypothetical protein n=1 Tax=Kosmotoga arenicorallina TaxID=688066 RepID=UPI000A8C888C|nr:hypothetical protein [Kosmotoga arenicorallina]
MKRSSVDNVVSDPVKYFSCRYPRILVIRAAFKLLKDGKSLSQKDMEGIILKMLKKR